MRKFLIVGFAAAIGGAALLIPVGATGAPTPGANFNGTVTPINVACAAGASTGTATYTVATIGTPAGSGNTGDADVIRVTREGGAFVTDLASEPASQQVTDTTFPCPGGAAGAPGSPSAVQFTFLPIKDDGSASDGSAARFNAGVLRTEDGS